MRSPAVWRGQCRCDHCEISVAEDLRNHKDWIEAHKYAATSEIFNGEIGELHNCRFIENVFAPILGGDYANKAGSVTYTTYFFGKDAFGIIDPDGGALEMIVKDKSQIGGPLNQFSTIGYKFETNGATILYVERVLRVMSCFSYSGIESQLRLKPCNPWGQGCKPCPLISFKEENNHVCWQGCIGRARAVVVRLLG